MLETELCVSSIEALHIANKYPFDRIELCQSLEIGGLTPSIGFIDFASKISNIELHILIRQRAGGFVYSSDELELMLNEIYNLKNKGLNGFVIGAINSNLELNVSWLKEAIQISSKHHFTFHRAFDDLQIWDQALETLIELGFKRILSSGKEKSVKEGASVLSKMKKQARGRIQIMCGGGINASNILEICEEIKPDAVHFSATEKKTISTNSIFSTDALIIQEENVKQIFNQLNKL